LFASRRPDPVGETGSKGAHLRAGTSRSRGLRTPRIQPPGARRGIRIPRFSNGRHHQGRAAWWTIFAVALALTDRYAADKGIEVTPEEIDAYVEATARLASPNLSDAERRALVSERDSLSRLQRTLDEMAKGDAEDPEETRQARRTVAAAFIRQWKINQALYREHDGRVIFQQGGPEPLDAYRKFIAAQHGQRAFRILDEDFEHRGLSVRRCLTGKSR
jgi:hypothetical protein